MSRRGQKGRDKRGRREKRREGEKRKERKEKRKMQGMSWLICRRSLKLYQDESKKSKLLWFLLVLIHAYIPITKSDASFLKPTGHSWPGEFQGGGCEQGFTYDSAATLSLLPPLQLCFQEKPLPWVWTAYWVTSPLRRHHSQMLFCFYFYWLVCNLLTD